MLYIESMKISNKSWEKSILLGKGKSYHVGLHTEKPLTDITELIEPFSSTEWKLSKQEEKRALSNSSDFLEKIFF